MLVPSGFSSCNPSLGQVAQSGLCATALPSYPLSNPGGGRLDQGHPVRVEPRSDVMGKVGTHYPLPIGTCSLEEDNPLTP